MLSPRKKFRACGGDEQQSALHPGPKRSSSTPSGNWIAAKLRKYAEVIVARCEASSPKSLIRIPRDQCIDGAEEIRDIITRSKRQQHEQDRTPIFRQHSFPSPSAYLACDDAAFPRTELFVSDVRTGACEAVQSYNGGIHHKTIVISLRSGCENMIFQRCCPMATGATGPVRTENTPGNFSGSLRQCFRSRWVLTTRIADSDEVARAFRVDVARRSDMMSLGSGASLADNLWRSIVGWSSLDALSARERRRLWPVRLIRCALWTIRSRMASE